MIRFYSDIAILPCQIQPLNPVEGFFFYPFIMKRFLFLLLSVFTSSSALVLIFPKICQLPFLSGHKGAPGSEARAAEPEKIEGSNVCNVHNPSLTPYVPAADKSTGTAVIICPGGGHSKLCLGHEGYALAEWFRDHGIAAFVLKYRLSREPGSPYTLEGHAMDDTRRALRLVRSRAAEWHLDASRIGILGFSAGGELAAYSAMKSDAGKADSTDVIEQQSSRPDFHALIYPGKSATFTAAKGHAARVYRRWIQ